MSTFRHQRDTAELRRYQILAYIRYHLWRHSKTPTYRELGAYFNVSVSTIQTDIHALRETGRVIKRGQRIYVQSLAGK